MKLDLVWSAYFGDRAAIHQYDDVEQTKEHLFKEILDKEKECSLSMFMLVNRHTGTSYEVDLEHGRIFIRPIKTGVKSTRLSPESEVSGSDKYAYRLIYFRRVTRTMAWAGREVSDQGIQDIQYFLGFQYTNEKGENIKRLLQITKDDEVYIA